MTTKPASEELKPCPFCGGEAQCKEDRQHYKGVLIQGKAIGCFNPNCGIQPSTLPNENFPAFAHNWNTRTSPQAESVGNEAHISEFISVNKDGGRAFDLKAFAGTPQGREKLMRLITPPKSAKDGERQEALDALDSLAERFEFEDERQAGIHYRTIRAALTAKRDSGANVESNSCACKFVNDECVDICCYHTDLEAENKRLIEQNHDLIKKVATAHNAALSSGRLSSKAEWHDISTAKIGDIILGIIEYAPNQFGEPFLCHYDLDDKQWQCQDMTEAVPHVPTHWFDYKATLPQPPIAGGEE